jgi:hypothetical protein
MNRVMIMLFRRRDRRISRTEALTVRPIRAVDATLWKDQTNGTAKLNISLKPPRWGGWLFRMPRGATKTFELDELGLFVWESCDGKTPVHEIIRRLAKRYNLNLREVEVSTIQFLQMLARKRLIGMAIVKTDSNKDRE